MHTTFLNKYSVLYDIDYKSEKIFCEKYEETGGFCQKKIMPGLGILVAVKKYIKNLF